MNKCDICKKETDKELREIGLYGTNDYYILNVCEQCYELYDGDYYPLEEVDEIIK